MGRIKTKLIKRITLEIFHRHKDNLKKDFNENKQLIANYVKIPSKKLRNTIAGYLTRLMKVNKD